MTLNLTVLAIPKFPARVAAGTGMAIVKANGIWTFAISGDNIPPQTVSDPANTDVIIEMPDGSLAKVPLSEALASVAPVEETGRKNALLNGGMMVWQRTTSDAAVTTTRKYVADRWAVRTGAGTLTSVSRGTAPAAGRTPFLMTLTGNAGVTTVDIDQRITAANGFPLVGPMTFSALITNNSGSAFTPTLFVETPTVVDDWAASAVQNNAGAGDPLQSCPNGAATRVHWSADISGYADVTKGLGFRLRIPSGSLDLNTKTVSITEIQVEPRPTVDNGVSLFEVENFSAELALCERYFWKTFGYNVAPQTGAGLSNCWFFNQGVGAAAATYHGFNFPHRFRAVPTIVTYNPTAANALARNLGTSTDWSAQTTNQIGDHSVLFSFTSPAGSAAGQPSAMHVTAEAEL